MAPRGLGPIQLPFIVHSQKVILSKPAGTCILENQIEKQVARRVGVIFGIVTDLHPVQLSVAAENVAERNAFSAYAQEAKPELSQLGFTLGKARIKFRRRWI